MVKRCTNHYDSCFYGSIDKEGNQSYFRFFPKGKELVNVLEIIGSIIVLIVIIPFTGYIVADIILLFILFFRNYKWYSGLAISCAVTLALYVVFQLILQVPLPVGIFGW